MKTPQREEDRGYIKVDIELIDRRNVTQDTLDTTHFGYHRK